MGEPFEHAREFEQGEISGNVRLGKFEAQYEALFSEALEDGVITDEERAKLEQTASNLGLDRERILSLEKALTGAWELRHHTLAREARAEAPAASLRPLELESDPQVKALRRRIQELEAKVAELERDLELAKTHVEVDIDFSDVQPAGGDQNDPETLARRIRHDPRDAASLHALFTATQETDPDLAYRTAHVLVYLKEANAAETEFERAHAPDALIRPRGSLNADAWRRSLFHPDEETLTGEILSIVTSPVLLGRVAALRHHGLLPTFDPAALQDAKTSTVQSVRCFGWASAILGMNPPPLYAVPTWAGLVEMLPGMPPAAQLGKQALSGRSAQELAFLAGRHLASYREDHFLKMLLPNITDLEDIFLAALTISQPTLPLSPQAKERATPIARAIEPLLESAQKDRLRGHFLRFVEEGGRTNLNRWAQAAEATTVRAGMLLANDLGACERVMTLAGDSEIASRIDDLIVFFTSDRCSRLRKQLGVSVGSTAA